MANSLVPRHGERFKRPERDARLVLELFRRQVKRREPLDQRGECFLTFDTRQGRPEAVMDAGSEGYVRIRVPRDVEPVRLRKLRGISIGGGNEPPGPIEFAEDSAA